MKQWFSKLFAGRKANGYREWRTEDSIMKFVFFHLDSEGKLTAEAGDLPDENKDGEQLRFAPGLLDAVCGFEDPESSGKRIGELVGLLKQIVERGDKSCEQEFYRLITGAGNTIEIMDKFLEGICRESLSIEPYLFSFAKDLATKSGQREAVKFGIAMLGLCQNSSVLEILKILGRYEEFTVYAAVAITRLSDHPVDDLWHLAQKVDGWGKIQLVERLAGMDIGEPVKDWLVREGYKNSVMYEYLAFTCAVHGELHEKLQQPEIDRELFRSAADILEALIAEGGPAEDISDYCYAVPVIENFIRHGRHHACNLADFNTLYQLRNFLSGLQKDPEDCRKNGWNGDIITRCLAKIAVILDNRDWKPLVYNDLKSEDPVTYWNAKQAAVSLGIDLWETVWERLQANPSDPSSWYDVSFHSRPEHEGKVIDFALRNLPLEELATGPQNLLGMGPEYAKYSCLDAAVTYLQNYPRQGEKIVLAGLKSPVIRNRNMAIRVLDKWKQENWSPEIRRELMHLKDIEPNQNTCVDIVKILNGQEI